MSFLGGSKNDRVCDVCHAPFVPAGDRTSFEMPAIWPSVTATEHACSVKCYREWVARQET